jgi:hypothetical protein
MAAEPKGAGAGTRKIKLDELAARVVADPKTPGDTILVSGFLGDSSEPDHIRIYWDASMSSYIDTNAADVVHTEPLPKDQSPFGGSYIWLKRSASGLSGGQGGNPMTGRFFEGPLMTAYGAQFGGPAPAAAGAVGTGTIAYSYYIACHPTIQLYCQSVVHPCVSLVCTRTVQECTLLCPPVFTVAQCPVASPGCPPVGPGTPVQTGTPVQGQFAAMADPAAAAQMQAQMLPSLVCSYAPHCWYSWGACPTQYGCGPHITPHCPQFQAQAQAAAGPAIAGSYAPHCWYSWNACPTMVGAGCGAPHVSHQYCTAQFQAQAQAPAAAAGAQAAAGPAIAGSYAPHCWYSWNACPTMFGVGCGGPHVSHPCLTQFQAQAQAPAAAAGAQAMAGPAIAGSYAPHCWYSWNACPTMFGCGPFHTPNCPI